MRAALRLRRLSLVALALTGCGDELAGLPSASGSDTDFGSSSGPSGPDATTTGLTSDADDSAGEPPPGKTSYVDTTNGGDAGDTNAPPTAVDDELFTSQDTALVLAAFAGVLANDSDPDGDTLNVTAFDSVTASGGNVVVAGDGAVQYEPAPDFWGPDSFEYTIEDEAGASATATVTVSVAPLHISLAAVASGIGGFALDGEARLDESGGVAGPAGDVNGDGLDDVIIAAPRADPNGTDSGRTYVVFGTADPGPVQLSTIAAGVGGFVLNGEAEDDHSGRFVSAAGDVNSDGLDDLVVSASDYDSGGSSRGRIYVVFGKADTAPVELSSVAAGAGGFILNAEEGDRSGLSVSAAGDVNADGIDDIVISANRPVGSYEQGLSYVVFGRGETTPVELSSVAAGVGGFVLTGGPGADSSGFPVSEAGDINADGFDDILLGASLVDANGPRSGRSYVVFGKADTAAVELPSIADGAGGGFVLNGEYDYDGSGRSVSAAGDVNGDGLDDVIIGAPGAEPNDSSSGRSYVVFGKADSAAVELSSITAGSGGFVVNGEPGGGGAVVSVSAAGDLNGDGLDDVIIGASGALALHHHRGRSYVVFGKVETDPVELTSIIAGIGGFALCGGTSADRAGYSVGRAGDFDGDGLEDTIIGAPRADPNDEASGQSYIVFGVPMGDN